MLFGLPALAAAAPQSATDRARSIASELQASVRTPGFAAAIWKGGAIAWSFAGGKADLENAADVSPRTRFRIGSLSKLLTAAAAVRLADRGALDLDAPIQQYVPSFPQKEGKITARLLLGHLAGIKHYGNADYINRQRYTKVVDTLKPIQDAPLLHAPGSKYFYSSYGFNLLGAALETAASQDFLAVIRREVSEPAGMASTVADENDRVIAGRTRFYTLSGDQVANAPYTDLSDRWPSGGFLSTAEDLARFGGLHLSDGFLKPEIRRSIFTSQATADGKETGTGFAWRIATLGGKRVFHHGGDAVGGRAFLLLRPEDGIAVAMLANLNFARFAETQAMQISDCFV
jgi:CubicO group peptidase (beta-lactamase class C family)